MSHPRDLLSYHTFKASLKNSAEYYEDDVKVGFTPINTIDSLLRKPKTKLGSNKNSGVIYKICCFDCDFVYYGQTGRALNTRIKEHKKAISVFDSNSKLACHANVENHNMDFNNATIVDIETNYHKRMFLEAWYSLSDSNAGNEHIDIPEIYQSLH